MELPYKHGFIKARSLWKRRRFYYIISFAASCFFFFAICPLQIELDAEAYRLSEMEASISKQQKNNERKESILTLVEGRDAFTMERLVREEFGLKREKETGSQSPAFNMGFSED